jgi:3',5'-cyclic AMP phosphodiesterase CpdA
LAGDLSHHGTEAELRSVKEIFSRLAIPVFVLPGNHDYVTQTDRTAYDRVFPGRLNYYFEFKGWQFIGFDSTEGLRASDTRIHEPAVTFISETLKSLSETQPTVAFTHFPLGETVSMRPLNAEDVLEMFKQHNLQATFGGHHHGFTERTFQHATLVTNRCCSFSQANHDTTLEKGYFLCEAKGGHVSRSFVEVSTEGI